MVFDNKVVLLMYLLFGLPFLGNGHTGNQTQVCTRHRFALNIPANVDLWSSMTDTLLGIVVTMKWTSVVIITSSSTDTLEANARDAFLWKLHARGLFTIVSEDRMTIMTMTTMTNRSVSTESNFIVLGAYSFVQDTFTTIDAGIKAGNITPDTLYSEWLTTIPADKIREFNEVIEDFQNIAVVTNSPSRRSSLCTLHREKNDTELEFVTSLPPSPTRPLTLTQILPNRSQPLRGRRLTIVVKDLATSLFKVKNGSEDVYQGVLISMLQELSHRLQFSYTLIPPVDDSWGVQLNDSQWDGPIGMLIRKEADMALGAFIQSYERSKVADPLRPFLYGNAQIIFRKETETATNHWYFYLRPFQKSVFLVVAVCLVTMLLLLLLLERLQWDLAVSRQTLRQPSGPNLETVLLWMAEITELLVAGLLQESVRQSSLNSRPGRVLLMTWLLLGVILASVYSSQLTSSLAVPRQALPFNSLAQLIKQDTYKWGVSGGTTQEWILRKSTNPEFQAFYRGAQRFAASDPSVLSSDYEVQKRKVFTERYAYFVATSELYEVWASQACGLELIPKTYLTLSVGPFMQKGSPYTRLISEEIGRMVDSGLVDYWNRKWLPEKRQCGNNNHRKAIGLDDTQTAFYVAAIGVGLAAVVMAMERLVSFYTARRRVIPGLYACPYYARE